MDHSVTTATRLIVPRMVFPEAMSTVTVSEYVPSAWKPSKDIVDFPPPPAVPPTEKFFECPYCFTICSTGILGEKAWRAHLIHDLRPYICTYKECRTPGQLYDSRRDWIQHEDRNHRRVFRCPEHEDQSFGTLAEYEQHIRVQHDRNASAHEGLFANHLAESTQLKSDRCCPVCSLALETAQIIQSHITLHLERLSLFSMPRSVGDDVGSQATGSENAILDIEGSGVEDLDVQLTFSDDANSIVCNEVEVDEAEGNDDLYQHCLEFDDFGMEVNPVSMETILKEVEKIDRLLKKDDPGSLASMADLVLEYSYDGKLNEAERLRLRIVETQERVLGCNHPKTLASMGYLAATYLEMGRLKDAETLQVQIVETKEAMLGPDHSDTIRAVLNLASLWETQGKLDQAEELYMRALAGYEHCYGPIDVKTLKIVDTLGGLFRDKSRLQEAEHMFLRALVGYEKIGQNEVLRAVEELPEMYKEQGRSQEAEQVRDRISRAQARHQKNKKEAEQEDERNKLESEYEP